MVIAVLMVLAVVMYSRRMVVVVKMFTRRRNVQNADGDRDVAGMRRRMMVMVMVMLMLKRRTSGMRKRMTDS